MGRYRLGFRELWRRLLLVAVSGSGIFFALTVIAATAVSIPAADWVMRNVPFVEFRPVCVDYERRRRGEIGLRLMVGDPTEEFWDELIRYHTAPDLPSRYWPGVAVYEGKVYYIPLFYTPQPKEIAKFEGEFEEYAYIRSRNVMHAIFQRRLAENRFDGLDMDAFTAVRGTDGLPAAKQERMRHDACGFAEELIMQCGRFAPPFEE